MAASGHNGLTSGIGNAVFNKSDALTIVVDNNYAAATGGQDLLSSQGDTRNRSTQHSIERAARGVGVKWAKTVRTYDIAEMRKALKEAVSSKKYRPQGTRSAIGMHAEPGAPRETAIREGCDWRKAGYARSIRGRRGNLYRRSRLHSPEWVPHLSPSSQIPTR